MGDIDRLIEYQQKRDQERFHQEMGFLTGLQAGFLLERLLGDRWFETTLKFVWLFLWTPSQVWGIFSDPDSALIYLLFAAPGILYLIYWLVMSIPVTERVDAPKKRK